VSNLPENQMAVGTGFAQLLRGLGMSFLPCKHHITHSSTWGAGQVGGLAAASAIFQSRLDSELRRYIHGSDAEDVSPTGWQYTPFMWLNALTDRKKHPAFCPSCARSPARSTTYSERCVCSELEICVYASSMCFGACISSSNGRTFCLFFIPPSLESTCVPR